MQINTKFNIGQELYVCTDIAAKQNQCSICHGYGKVTIKYESFICPKCQGASAHQQKEYKPEKIRIHKIRASASTNNIGVKYSYFDETGKRRNIAESKNLLFTTQGEAQARCNELNEENKTMLSQLKELKGITDNGKR